MATGADAFLRKPIDFDQLLPLITRLCAHSDNRELLP